MSFKIETDCWTGFMSFIRLEDAEFRALFSLIPSRVCFVYYINRVSSILKTIIQLYITSFYMKQLWSPLCWRLHDTAFTHRAVYFSTATLAVVFLQCPQQEWACLSKDKILMVNWCIWIESWAASIVNKSSFELGLLKFTKMSWKNLHFKC